MENLSFEVLKTINLGEHRRKNINKILEDYRQPAGIVEATVDERTVTIAFENTNAHVFDFSKPQKHSIPESIDGEALSCILSITYYLNMECTTSIKINLCVESTQIPEVNDFAPPVQCAAKYLGETFGLPLAPAKILSRDSSSRNQNRYILVPEELVNSVHMLNWDGYDIDFSVLPLDLNQIVMLLQNNKFLVPLVVNQGNHSLITLVSEDVNICEKLQNNYVSTVNFCKENQQRLSSAEKDSLIKPEDLSVSIDNLLQVQKEIIIRNMLTHFTTKYDFEIDQDKVLNKFKNRDFHYKDIVVEMLSAIDWIQFDEAFKSTQENFLRELIKSGYNESNITIKRKRIVFRDFTSIDSFSNGTLLKVNTHRNTSEGILKTLAVFESGEYLENLSAVKEISPFQTYYKHISSVREKYDFIRTFKNNFLRKIDALSVDASGNFTVEFKSDEEKERYLQRFVY